MIGFHNIDLYAKYLQYSEERSGNLINYINDKYHSVEINQGFLLQQIIIGSLIGGLNNNKNNKIKSSEIKKYVNDEKKRKKAIISKYKKISIPLMVPLYFVFEFGFAEPLMEEFVNYKKDGVWNAPGAADAFIEEYDEKTWQAWLMIGGCLVSGITGFVLRAIPERIYNKNQETLDVLYEASKKKQFALDEIVDLYIALIEDNFEKNVDKATVKSDLKARIEIQLENTHTQNIEDLERLASLFREKLFGKGDRVFKKQLGVENLFVANFLEKEETSISKCLSFIGLNSTRKVEPNFIV